MIIRYVPKAQKYAVVAELLKTFDAASRLVELFEQRVVGL